jgi:hypothetical protein
MATLLHGHKLASLPLDRGWHTRRRGRTGSLTVTGIRARRAAGIPARGIAGFGARSTIGSPDWSSRRSPGGGAPRRAFGTSAR